MSAEHNGSNTGTDPSSIPNPASAREGEVLAVCISPGSVPKTPVDSAEVGESGLVGDTQEHEKHRKPNRAVSLIDMEILDQLKREGFPVGPGVIGENVTVRGLGLQHLSVGDRLHFEDGPVLELTEPRKPCFILDKIDPVIKDAVVGRCGFMTGVVRPGLLAPGQRIRVESDPQR